MYRLQHQGSPKRFEEREVSGPVPRVGENVQLGDVAYTVIAVIHVVPDVTYKEESSVVVRVRL